MMPLGGVLPAYKVVRWYVQRRLQRRRRGRETKRPPQAALLSLGEATEPAPKGEKRFALFACGKLFGFIGLIIPVPFAAGVLVRFAVRQYFESPFYAGKPTESSDARQD